MHIACYCVGVTRLSGEGIASSLLGNIDKNYNALRINDKLKMMDEYCLFLEHLPKNCHPSRIGG